MALLLSIIIGVVVTGLVFWLALGHETKEMRHLLVEVDAENEREARDDSPLESEGAIRTLQDAYALSPIEFEDLVGQLFVGMGYQAEGTKLSGDEGIDLYLRKDDSLELVQCKRYKGNVGVPAVREFFGVVIHKKAQKGYIVTTGHFTFAAREFSKGKPIHLIDGPELAEMLTGAESENT